MDINVCKPYRRTCIKEKIRFFVNIRALFDPNNQTQVKRYKICHFLPSNLLSDLFKKENGNFFEGVYVRPLVLLVLGMES